MERHVEGIVAQRMRAWKRILEVTPPMAGTFGLETSGLPTLHEVLEGEDAEEAAGEASAGLLERVLIGSFSDRSGQRGSVEGSN